MRALVSIFAGLLILISLYQLSLTWFVNKHEQVMEEKAMQWLNRNYMPAEKKYPGNKELQAIYQDSLDHFYNDRLRKLLDSTRDTKITWWGQTYQKSKESELLLGLDLQGGVQVLLEARPPAGTKVDSDVLNGTRDAVERRVNGLGVSEPVIRTRGNDQISVELPGVNDIPDCLKDDDASDCKPEDLEIDSDGDGVPEAKLEDTDGNGTLDCLEDGNADDCRLPGLGAERAVRVLQRTALLEIIDPQGSFLPEGTPVRTSLNP